MESQVTAPKKKFIGSSLSIVCLVLGILLPLVIFMICILLYFSQYNPTITASNFRLTANMKKLNIKLHGEWKEAETYDRLTVGVVKVYRCGTLIVRDRVKIKMPAKTKGFDRPKEMHIPILSSVSKAELQKECEEDGYEFSFGHTRMSLM